MPAPCSTNLLRHSPTSVSAQGARFVFSQTRDSNTSGSGRPALISSSLDVSHSVSAIRSLNILVLLHLACDRFLPPRLQSRCEAGHNMRHRGRKNRIAGTPGTLSGWREPGSTTRGESADQRLTVATTRVPTLSFQALPRILQTAYPVPPKPIATAIAVSQPYAAIVPRPNSLRGARGRTRRTGLSG